VSLMKVGPACSMDQMAYSHAHQSGLESRPLRKAKGARSSRGDARSVRETMRLPAAHARSTLVDPRELICFPNSFRRVSKSMADFHSVGLAMYSSHSLLLFHKFDRAVSVAATAKATDNKCRAYNREMADLCSDSLWSITSLLYLLCLWNT